MRVVSLSLLLAACAPVAVFPRGDPRDPRIVEALARTTEASYRRDLDAIVGPRQAGWDEHLAEVAAYIEAELAAAGLEVRRQEVRHAGLVSDNVIGERRGREPGRVILLGAHYDTVHASPGADDNASGVAALLAAARAAGAVPTGATVRVVAFTFEEAGLVGSRAYVESLSEAELEAIECALVMDMIAYRRTDAGSQGHPRGAQLLFGRRPVPTVGDFIGLLYLSDLGPDFLRRVERGRPYVSGLRIEALQIPRIAIRLAPDVTRGDHASFWEVGVPALVYGDTAEYRNPHYHRPSDLVDTIDVPFAVAVSRWITATALELAR